MSFVDLATLAFHRRNEMEARINAFATKCDHAISNITKIKLQAQNFVDQLNCEPTELKERFLNCMKQLDEYTYLITDFNLSVGKLEETDSVDFTPVQDSSMKILMPIPVHHFNIMDVLSDPAQQQSTSTPCSNRCPPEKPRRKRIPKEQQTLIQFSSASCSNESVPISNSEIVEKKEQEVQCDLAEDMKGISLCDSPAPVKEICELPAQSVLEVDQVYPAVIMSIDGDSFWVITDNIDVVCNLMTEMKAYYAENSVELTVEDVTSLTYCVFYDEESDCYYRALFIRLTEENISEAEVFLVDTGEVRRGPCASVNFQPLAPRFAAQPPYARCCHLVGVELLCFEDKEAHERQEAFLQRYIGVHCSIKVDDNSSESLDVYVIMSNDEILNDVLVREGFAVSNASEDDGVIKIDEANKANELPKVDKRGDTKNDEVAKWVGPPKWNDLLKEDEVPKWNDFLKGGLPKWSDLPKKEESPKKEVPKWNGVVPKWSDLPLAGEVPKLGRTIKSEPSKNYKVPKCNEMSNGAKSCGHSKLSEGKKWGRWGELAKGGDQAKGAEVARGSELAKVGEVAKVNEQVVDSEFDITNCQEYEDPVEAVTGYRSRDEADVCKHYKGGPEKTCFKGARCTKKHIALHPEGWTLDRVEVIAKCKPTPLPAPGTWHRVHVTCVCHFDRVYVQLVKDRRSEEELPSFGVVLPPSTLEALVRDMNSPAAVLAYKRLPMAPAPFEMVAALYPLDNQWYRARVLSTTRADQSVEIMYVDYGNVVWVKEDAIRVLEPRFAVLPTQAVRCVLAGVHAKSHDSRGWAEAKKYLTNMVQDHTLDAHVIARSYDEVIVELFDEEGCRVAELLAAYNSKTIEFKDYSLLDDSQLNQRMVVP